MLARVTCAVHSDREVFARCSGCAKGLCEGCAAYLVDGAPSCATCAAHAKERSDALGGLVITVVGTTYLVLLALGFAAASKAKVLGAGVAAVGAIGLGRLLQVALKVPAHVTRRAPDVDAGAPPR